MRIEWTEAALEDMAAIRDYIAEDSPDNARRFIQRLFDAAEQLIDQPLMGRHTPEAARPDVREVLHQDYRIIYRVKPKQLDVLAVVHGSRELMLLTTKPWEGK